MKPRIYRYPLYGVWVWRCTRLEFKDYVGYGKTPYEAYANWNWVRLP